MLKKEYKASERAKVAEERHVKKLELGRELKELALRKQPRNKHHFKQGV